MNRPLRIALITTDARHWFRQFESATPNFGTAIQSLLQGFGNMPDLEIHVISASPTRLASPEKLGENIYFHHLQVPKWGWGRSLFLGVAIRIRRLVNELEIDLVHGQGTERDCSIAAVLSGKPNVLTIHGNMRVHAVRPEQKAKLYYRLVAALESFCLRRTDGVVAISSYTQRLVESLAVKTWLLPNAVDKRYYDVRQESDALPRILFVGSITERKNPIGLIKACEDLLRAGECTIAFAGEGDPGSEYLKEFHRLVGTLPGLEVLGFLGRDALGSQFGRAALLVLPTFEDNCPMVVLEAMAAGLPVAASRVGGVPDLIVHEVDGLMFDPNDPSDVRKCIEKLIKLPETRARLGAEGRITALNRFHPQVVADAHLKIYQEVLGR